VNERGAGREVRREKIERDGQTKPRKRERSGREEIKEGWGGRGRQEEGGSIVQRRLREKRRGGRR